MASSTLNPDRPAGSSGTAAGARWVSGLGALLLVMAAATFVAVRWGQIPDEAKFGALLAVTGACLGAERRLRRDLPVTAAALFHIGVLLVPVDVAAVGVWRGWEWPQMLLVQGLAVTTACGVAAYTRPSVVLRVAAWIGVVLLAGGVGAGFGTPAGLVLAATALGTATVTPLTDRTHRSSQEWAAAGWAALAGLATPLAAVRHAGFPAAGVLADLGITSRAPHTVAALTGLVAAAALFLVATRRRSWPAALAGAASLFTGATTTWFGLGPTAGQTLTAVTALMLAAELAAWALHRDPFWAGPTGLLATTGEATAATLTVLLGTVVLAAPADPPHSPTAGSAASLLTLTWVAASARRRSRPATTYWPWTRTTPGPVAAVPLAAATAAGTSVVLLSGTHQAAAVGLGAVGVLLLALPPTLAPGAPASRLGGVALLAWVPVVAHTEPALAGALAVAGAAGGAVAALDLARFRQAGAPALDALVRALAFLTLLPLASGGLVGAGAGYPAAATGGLVLAAWAVAAIIDRVEVAPLGILYRAATLVPVAVLALAHGSAFSEGEALVVASLLAGLALLDAVRLDEPLVLLGAGAGVPVALVSAILLAGGSLGEASVVVTLSGVVWIGVGGSLPARWALAAGLCGALAAGTGLLLSVEDAAAFNVNLMVIGTGLLVLGGALGQPGLVAAGGGVATLGVWSQLGLEQVTVGEPYVAPAALLMLLGGVHLRSRSQQLLGHLVSSWVAYAPPAALLGGVALVERLSGGAGWHAVVAGAVGVAAVAAGGAWRLAGPLFTGTVLVVAVAVHETLGVTAGIPTPAWLAAGGGALLGAGLVMERRGTGPVETGRRLVDMVGEHFS